MQIDGVVGSGSRSSHRGESGRRDGRTEGVECRPTSQRRRTRPLQRLVRERYRSTQSRGVASLPACVLAGGKKCALHCIPVVDVHRPLAPSILDVPS